MAMLWLFKRPFITQGIAPSPQASAAAAAAAAAAATAAAAYLPLPSFARAQEGALAQEYKSKLTAT
jgi:hypothetical protein